MIPAFSQTELMSFTTWTVDSLHEGLLHRFADARSDKRTKTSLCRTVSH